MISSRKAKHGGHLYRLYIGSAHFVWNSYAARFICIKANAPQIAGGYECNSFLVRL
jgi:hypothetical protein